MRFLSGGSAVQHRREIFVGFYVNTLGGNAELKRLHTAVREHPLGGGGTCQGISQPNPGDDGFGRRMTVPPVDGLLSVVSLWTPIMECTGCNSTVQNMISCRNADQRCDDA